MLSTLPKDPPEYPQHSQKLSFIQGQRSLETNIFHSSGESSGTLLSTLPKNSTGRSKMKRTLKEASAELGISVKALRYRIKAKGLEAEMEDGQHGRRYVLSEEQMQLLGTLPSATDEDGIRSFSGGSSKTTQDRTQNKPQNHTEDPEHPEEAQYTQDRSQETTQKGSQDRTGLIPVGIYKETQEALREALSLSREQRNDRLEAERRADEAEENAYRLARQVQELMYNMEQQKMLLSENAESLQEDRAKVLQTEAQIEELKTSREQVTAQMEELYRHKAEEKAQLEREKEEIAQKLREVEAAAEKAASEAQEKEQELEQTRASLEELEAKTKGPFWKRWFK